MTDYNKLTVVKLKDVLKERGLPLTGLKAALVARLVEDDEKVDNTADDETANAESAQPEAQTTEHDDNVSKSPVAQIRPEQASPEVTQADPPASTVQALDKSLHNLESPQLGTVVADEPTANADLRLSNETQPLALVPSPPASPGKSEPKNKITEAEETSGKVEEIPIRTEIISDVAPSQVYQAASSELSSEKPDTQTQVSTQTSVDKEELLEDTRKRKRRSQSPPPSSIDVSVKKTKTLDGSPRLRLPEDSEGQLAVPEVTQTLQILNEEPVEPLVVTDDTKNPDTLMEDVATTATEVEQNLEIVKEEPERPAVAAEDSKDHDTHMDDEPQQTHLATIDKPKSPSKPSPTNTKFKGLFAAPPSANALQIDQDPSASQDRDITPALHPATTALYIRNFMRPLHPAALKDHLESLARSTGGPSEQEIIMDFFLDGIKTHCLVQFNSISSASKVRLALHERVWPDERARKALWVDYIPEEKIKKWIEVEQEAGGGRGAPQKRWEVVYEKEGDDIAAYLQEADGSGPHGTLLVARAVENGRSGPSGLVSSERQGGLPIASKGDSGKGFKALDDLFKSTTAKPKLYYQPVSESIVNERLDKLAEGRGGGRNDEMRRYTFEKSSIVDNGAEYGPGWRGGGRGRGGYSRGYSGRGGYRSDSWREHR